jgi:DNA modification methylase
MLNEVIEGDCVEKLKDLPDNSVDLVVTSPPYDNIEGSGYSKGKKDVLFLKLYSDFFDGVLNEIYRVLKPTGQLYLNLKSGTINKTLVTPHWIEFLESFKQFKLKSYIIWKYSGSFDSTKVRFHLDYEIIYHLSKTDDITINYESDEKDPLTSVWYIPHFITNRLHPVQMPEALAEKIIKRGSKEGDLVLDVFAGSGTSLVVAKKLNRNFIGIEINPEHINTIKKRLNE